MDHLPYLAAWKDLRRRTQWFYAVLIGGIVLTQVLITVLSRVSLLLEPEIAARSVWAATLVVAALRVLFFRCPRCSDQFFVSGWQYSAFTTQCVHCSLPKGQESP